MTASGVSVRVLRGVIIHGVARLPGDVVDGVPLHDARMLRRCVVVVPQETAAAVAKQRRERAVRE